MDSDLKEILEAVTFMKDRMVTADDVRDIVREEMRNEVRQIVKEEVQEALVPIESKLGGIEKRLDIEAGIRDDQKIPARVADLEINAFGASRAPQAAAA